LEHFQDGGVTSLLGAVEFGMDGADGRGTDAPEHAQNRQFRVGRLGRHGFFHGVIKFVGRDITNSFVVVNEIFRTSFRAKENKSTLRGKFPSFQYGYHGKSPVEGFLSTRMKNEL